ncbi:MBL fold metallo-hydrolase [Novosphingobium sp. FSW06-99]|uniref:MBL fold metallo-hydrolase n=1 Tax=Novosphingobium sp. FSW06-99 TaxID=1739113 RepID=UPI00076CE270|nr:MBL fold metallo-hydrolase [Novosphingobium sp. FSW06-99]KUR77441.1 hypothetical protein AQZ49_09925 [Novosphingobium sp. FSW06-99]
MAYLRALIALFALVLAIPAMAAPVLARHVTVITLSTMLADQGIGEWGYAALVEVDGHRVLFDTGAHADVVLRNAADLHIDLSTVEDVVITHFHDDHTGGLLALRKAMMAKNPAALSRLHVGAGIMADRFDARGHLDNGFPALARAYVATGATLIEHGAPVMLVPGLWLTGPVPRHHDETNFDTAEFVHTTTGAVVDPVAEDSSLVIATADGPIIVTGCGHAGIMNIADAAQAITGDARLLAVIGGLHLFAKPDAVLVATAARLKGLRYLLAGHCTGIEATWRLRGLLGLDRHTAVVEAVGSRFVWGEAHPGIVAGDIAG